MQIANKKSKTTKNTKTVTIPRLIHLGHIKNNPHLQIHQIANTNQFFSLKGVANKAGQIAKHVWDNRDIIGEGTQGLINLLDGQFIPAGGNALSIVRKLVERFRPRNREVRQRTYNSNSLTSDIPLRQQFKMENYGQAKNFRRKLLSFEIRTPLTPLETEILTYDLSPSNNLLYDWLSEVTEHYSLYTVKSLKFYFVTAQPTSAPGGITIGVNPNVASDIPQSFEDVTALKGAITAPIYGDSVVVEVSQSALKQRKKFLIKEPVLPVENTDPASSPGRLDIAYNFTTGDTIIGRVYAEVDVTLYSPKLSDCIRGLMLTRTVPSATGLLFDSDMKPWPSGMPYVFINSSTIDLYGSGTYYMTVYEEIAVAPTGAPTPAVITGISTTVIGTHSGRDGINNRLYYFMEWSNTGGAPTRIYIAPLIWQTLKCVVSVSRLTRDANPLTYGPLVSEEQLRINKLEFQVKQLTKMFDLDETTTQSSQPLNYLYHDN